MNGVSGLVAVISAIAIVEACSAFSEDKARVDAAKDAHVDVASGDAERPLPADAASTAAGDALDCTKDHVVCDDFEDVDASSSHWILATNGGRDGGASFSMERPHGGKSGVAIRLAGGPSKASITFDRPVAHSPPPPRVHCQLFVSSAPAVPDWTHIIGVFFQDSMADYEVSFGPEGSQSRLEQFDTGNSGFYSDVAGPGYDTATWTKIELDVDLAGKIVARAGGGADIAMDSGIPSSLPMSVIRIGVERAGGSPADLTVFIDDVVCDAR